MTGHNINLPSIDGIEFVDYIDERQLEDVMRLVGQDLSEPYSGEDFTLSFLPTLNNFIEQIILSHMKLNIIFVLVHYIMISIHLPIFPPSMAQALHFGRAHHVNNSQWQ